MLRRFWRRWASWVRLSLLEGRLQYHGYRRLHEAQVEDARIRSKRVIHDLADAVIMLRTVAEQVEGALKELEGDWESQ